MAKHDVNKMPFSKKKIDGFVWNVDGRRQIDAGEGTESFALISAAVFFRYWENPAGVGIRLPPAQRVLRRTEEL